MEVVACRISKINTIFIAVVCGKSGSGPWGCHGRWLGIGQH